MFHKQIKGSKFKKVDLADAQETYDFNAANNDNMHLEDLFGEEPEYVYVHQGHVHVAGDLKLRSDEGTVYVVDGDLTVDGNLGIRQMDVYTTLYVTGSVTVKNLALTWDSQLWIGRDLTVKEVLVTGLSDAGSLIVKGTTSVPTWIEAMSGSGAIELKKKPKARFIGEHDDEVCGKAESAEDALVPGVLDDESIDEEKLEKAVLAGKPVLKGAAAGSKKKA